MGKQSIVVELDDETINGLTLLGKPVEVLAQLAWSAVESVRRPSDSERAQTDASLRVERDKTDAFVATKRRADEEEADEVVRLARLRADQVVLTAQGDADRERRQRPKATGASSVTARADLEHERAQADEIVENERAERSADRARFLTFEREATDKDLSGERAHADTLIVDQRDANAQMVNATIRAQELADEAEAAMVRAEESERALRAVAEFREMFIGILGHDLRNPVGAIVMAAALLLRRGHLNERDAEAAALIIRSSQRITGMITQLLDLTRARLGGGLPIDPKPMDLREVCQNVLEEFEAPVQLDVLGDVTGTWDQDRLAQVFSNLARNAIEYAAPGTVVIVKAHAEAADVVVEISNQGAPIPADLLPFIFEPFRGARRPQKSTTGNLGLGLYIAKQIVLSHGGTLDAHCRDGTTTFVVRLPRLRDVSG